MDELGWMGLFALVIFGEKMWTRGMWIARGIGICLIILGVASWLGLITIYDNMMGMNKDMQSQTQGGNSMNMPHDKIENKNASGLSHANNATTNKVPTMSPGMGM